jgi:hypothetical protein
VTKTQLEAPTCTPPSGQIAGGSSVTINPPADLPTGGELFYNTNGTVPTSTTGLLYNGPIQVLAAETIIAIAHDPAGNFLDSAPVSCVYTLEPVEAGTLGPVVVLPPAQTEYNDFTISLTPPSAGANVCYTTGTTSTLAAPTCTPAGGCAAGSTAWTGTAIPVNGSLTDATSGGFWISAIACEAGDTPSVVSTQAYTLQVADPTMSINGIAVPPSTPTNVKWVNNGPAAIISTTTLTSVSPPNAPTLSYSTTALAPNCTGAGQSVASGTTLHETVNTNTQVIGCKLGYHPSNTITFETTVQLNAPPLLAGGTFNYAPVIKWAGVGVANAGIDDSANTGSGDLLCASINATPVCGTLPGGNPTCTTGTPLAQGTNYTIGNNKTASNIVNIIACGPTGLNASTVSTQTYTLQYAPAYIYTTQNLVAGATDLPGWDWAGTGNPPGQPISAAKIPATAAAGWPGSGSGFFVDVVQNVSNGVVCTGTAGDGIQGLAAGNLNPGTCTQTPVYQTPDSYCASNTATTAACGCAAADSVNYAAGAGVLVPAAVDSAKAGGTISVIPCQAATGSSSPYVFQSPAATTVTFSAAGAATAPTIAPQATNPDTVQETVVITNNDTTTGGSYIAVTFGAGSGAVPASPTCSAGVPAATAGIYCWGGAANGWVQSTGANCVKTPASGTTGNTVTISPGAGAGLPGAVNGPGLVQTTGEVVVAIACNTQETPSPTNTQTFNFQGAEPNFTSTAGVASGKTGDLNTATSIGAGAVVNLSSTSNFDLPNPPATQAMTIHWSTSGTATCGSAGVVTASGVAGSPPVSTWPVNGTNPVAPTSGSTWTLSAVTCGQNDGVLQAISPARTVEFNLVAATPVLSTNQDGPSVTPNGCHENQTAPACACSNLGTCGTAGHPPCCCSNTNPPSCTPASPWENAFNAYLTSTTPGASICYSTTTTATCNAGTCTGTSVASPATIPLTAAGETLSYLGCLPGLTASATQTFTAVLDTDQGFAGSGGAASCNANTKVGESLLATDTSLGGPTDNACVCFTTDGSTPSCQANATGCTGTPTGTTTCVSTGAAGTTQGPPAGVTITGNTTFTLKSCAQGFNPTSSTQTYSLNPYRTTGIVVDGNLQDWNKGADTAIASGFPPDTGEAFGTEATYTIDMAWYDFATGAGDPFLAGKGMVTYSNTNLYIGVEASILNASGYPNQCYTPTNGACTPAAATYVAAYVGNGVQATGAGTDVPFLDTIYEAGCSYSVVSPNRTIATGGGIQYALLYRSDGGIPVPAAYAWNSTSQTWGSTTLAGVQAGFDAGTNTIELGIPLASIGLSGTSTSVTAFVSEIADVGQAGPPRGGNPVCGNSDELFRFPLDYPSDPAYFDLYQSFYNVNLTSCNAPNTQIVYVP